MLEFYHAVWKTAIFEARYYLEVTEDSQNETDIESIRARLRDQMLGNIKHTTTEGSIKIGCLKNLLQNNLPYTE
jgi:hypothetical protein